MARMNRLLAYGGSLVLLFGSLDIALPHDHLGGRNRIEYARDTGQFQPVIPGACGVFLGLGYICFAELRRLQGRVNFKEEGINDQDAEIRALIAQYDEKIEVAGRQATTALRVGGFTRFNHPFREAVGREAHYKEVRRELLTLLELPLEEREEVDLTKYKL